MVRKGRHLVGCLPFVFHQSTRILWICMFRRMNSEASMNAFRQSRGIYGDD